MQVPENALSILTETGSEVNIIFLFVCKNI